MDHPIRVLGVFAKWPGPGAVKTRLAVRNPALGARVARAFLLDTLDRVADLDARRVLVFAPPETHDEFAAIAGSRFRLQAQQAGDLGQRMAAFFSRELASGASQVAVIGTDSPTLPSEFVDQAFAALDTADVVLGPATDGGYYLLGCGRRLPPVFDGIDWGTSRVLEQTISRLAGTTWRVAVLKPWYDVDTPDDWATLSGHVAALRLAGDDPQVPRTEALLSEVGPDLAAPKILVRPCEG
jgi:rSAM/selenodomain-associated transferase 1